MPSEICEKKEAGSNPATLFYSISTSNTAAPSKDISGAK